VEIIEARTTLKTVHKDNLNLDGLQGKDPQGEGCIFCSIDNGSSFTVDEVKLDGTSLDDIERIFDLEQLKECLLKVKEIYLSEKSHEKKTILYLYREEIS